MKGALTTKLADGLSASLDEARDASAFAFRGGRVGSRNQRVGGAA